MTLVVPVSPQVQAKLRQQAQAQGQELWQYAARLLTQAGGCGTLDELLAPLRAQFAASTASATQNSSSKSAKPARHSRKKIHGLSPCLLSPCLELVAWGLPDILP